MYRLFLLLGLLVSFNASGDQLCQKDINIGDNFVDSWILSGCRSTNRTMGNDPYYPQPAYAKYYTFTLDRDADLKVTLVGGINIQLNILDGGSQQSAILRSINGSEAKVRLSAGNTYTIEATTPYFTYNFSISLKFNDIGSLDCVQSLEMGVPVSDGWVQSCESNNRDIIDPYSPYPELAARAKYFTFTLLHETEVRIDVTSDVDTFIYLLQGLGEFSTPLAAYDNEPLITTLLAGEYTIELTTNSRYAPGRFTLLMEEITATALCNADLPLNQFVKGSWSSNCLLDSWYSSNQDPYVGNSERAKYYHFSVDKESDLRFSTSFSDSNLLMSLYRDGELHAEPFASTRPGYNSNYLSANMDVHLTAGAYTLEATSFQEPARGYFEFSSISYEYGTCSNQLSSWGTFQSVLVDGCYSIFRLGGSSDPYAPYAGNYYAKRFEFTLDSPRALNAHVNQTAQPAYMYLAKKSADNTIVLLDETVNYQYYGDYDLYRELNKGTYIVEVTSRYPNNTTPFQLSLTENTSNVCNSFLELDLEVNSNLGNSTLCTSAFKRSIYNYDPYNFYALKFYAKAYSFEITSPGMYSLDVSSNDFSPQLILTKGPNQRGQLLIDNLSSNIVRWFEAGYYTVEVNTETAESKGNYTLVLHAAPSAVNATDTGTTKEGSKGGGTVGLGFLLVFVIMLVILSPRIYRQK